jgi:hypothetical protein
MDPVAFLAAHAAYIMTAVGVSTLVNEFVDRVVRPMVSKSASKRDDVILETYIDPPLRFVSASLSFFSLRMGRK